MAFLVFNIAPICACKPSCAIFVNTAIGVPTSTTAPLPPAAAVAEPTA